MRYVLQLRLRLDPAVPLTLRRSVDAAPALVLRVATVGIDLLARLLPVPSRIAIRQPVVLPRAILSRVVAGFEIFVHAITR